MAQSATRIRRGVTPISGGAERELILRVHIQDSDGGSADGRLANHIDAAPREVVFPAVAPRMEQFRDLVRLRVNARQVRTFVEIAVDARQGQVGEVIGAAVRPREDVLDVEHGQW